VLPVIPGCHIAKHACCFILQSGFFWKEIVPWKYRLDNSGERIEHIKGRFIQTKTPSTQRHNLPQQAQIRMFKKHR